MRKPWLILVLFLLTAFPAAASVRVNEIAWMGSAASSNDEWIELVNDGVDPVVLDGWHLRGKDGSPDITLKGNILSGQYYLIERTDDASVPNIDANLVASFGKGLSNEGETLVLTNASGTPIDMVSGGKDWSKIGGDNKTKHTAQRTVGGWVSGIPTPGAQNIVPQIPKVAAVPVSPVPPPIPKTALLASAQAAAPVIQEKILTQTQETYIATASDVTASVLWEKQDSSVNGTVLLWMVLAIVLFIVATLIIMRTEVAQPSDADQYAIIEDIIEGDEDDAKIYLNKSIWDE